MPDTEAIRLFIGERQAGDCAPATIRGYRHYTEQYRTWLRGRGETVFTVTEAHIRAYQFDLLSGDYSRSTVRLAMTVVRMLHRFLREEGVTTVDPASRVRPPRAEQTLRPTMREAQVLQFLNSFNPARFNGARDRCLALLMIDTGIRVGEAVRLTLEDYDPQSLLLSVRHTKSRRDRVVPVSPAVDIELDAYLKRRVDYPGAALFCLTDGERLKTARVRQIFREKSKRLGWRVYPHLCRHYFATTLLQRGADLETVRRILGHSSLEATALYLHTDIGHITEQHTKYSPTNGLL